MVDIVGIACLSHSDQLKILSIRNQEAVRKNMYTSHVIQEDEHFRWIEKLKQDSTTRFFAVLHNGEIVGGASLNAISTPNRRADWAFYLSAETQGKGIGSKLEFKFLNYAFEHANLLKLNCEVFEFNVPVIAMHKKFGFVDEGCRRSHIFRDGESLDVRLLGITKQEWFDNRQRFGGKFQ